MSFGYGVDIMAISGLAIKVYTAYKDAPGDYRNISDEVKSLDIIINNAAQHFKSTTLSDNKRQEGQEVLRGCQRVLEDLDALIVKYNGLASTSTSRVFKRIKLGIEDIVTLRARLTSNTTLLNGFIQSCDSDKMQAQLDSVLGLRRTMSRDSIVSFAGSINTKKAYKKFCKGLFEIGVTADIIKQKEKEIQDMLKPATSNQIDDSTFVDPNQLPEVGTASDAETSPISAATMSTETPRSRSRFGWIRPSIDFLVGPLMLSAAEAGDAKRLISTLEYVRNINFADNQKRTALYFAAMGGHSDIVQLLLAKGALTEASSEKGWTPLHLAAACGHMGIVELLLEKGASTEATMGTCNWTPLHWAVEKDHAGVVVALLGKGASTEAVTNFGSTPLHLAAWNGHASMVKLLLGQRASVEALNEDDETPSQVASRKCHLDIVELLNSKATKAVVHGNRT